jgi:hypothetical protein
MNTAVGKQEVGIGTSIAANLIEEKLSFKVSEESHTGRRKQENWGISGIFFRDNALRMCQKLRQMLGPDRLGSVGEGRNTF